MNVVKPAVVVAMFAVWCSSILGQGELRDAREELYFRATSAFASYRVAEDDESGSLKIPNGEPFGLEDWAEAVWSIYTNRNDPDYRLTMPFHSPGEIQRVGTRLFLVSGIRYSSLDPLTYRGVICRVRLVSGDRPSIVIDEQQFVDPDPLGLQWNDDQGHLYFWDRKQGKVFVAPWPGWPSEDSEPNLPTAEEFREIVNAETIPRLKFFGSGLHAATLPRGGGVRFGSSRHDRHGRGRWYQIIPLGSNWTVRSLDGYGRSWELDYSHPPRWRLENEARLGSEKALTITVGATTKHELREFGILNVLSGRTIVRGLIPKGQSSATIPMPPAFMRRPGAPFRITGSHGRPSNLLFPMLRLGAPVSSESGLLTRLELPPAAATVGNRTGFALGTELQFESSKRPSPVSLYLGLALHRSESDHYPVAELGEGKVALDAELVYQIPRETLKFNRWFIPVSHQVPIGTEDALVGSLSLWQWLAVFEDGSVACTDVVGTTLWPRGQEFIGQPGVPMFPEDSAHERNRFEAARNSWRRELEERGFLDGVVFRRVARGLREE